MRRITLQWKITFLAFGVVLISILVTGLFLALRNQADVRDELGRRALAIGRTVAQNSSIRDAVGQPGGETTIQPIAEKVRHATNVDYIVVLDMEKRRYSHPLVSKIGTKFAGGDEDPSFADNEYTSIAEGLQGNTVRAFIPIKNAEGTEQLGVVVVGILSPSMWDILLQMRWGLHGALLIGLIVGSAGAFALAKSIKGAILGLEPEEIATLVEQREALLQAISEGIISINHDNIITLINESACRILQIDADQAIGRVVTEIVPYSRLPEVVQKGDALFNQEVLVGSIVVVSNIVPIRPNGKIIGAVAVFRDKMEVRRLAEELTGVKKFVEALRVQNHENQNKLHTIAGLIQLDRQEEALDFIFRTTEAQQELTGFLTKRVKDYGLAGLLMGKLGRALELGIKFKIDDNTSLTRLPKNIVSSDLVVIMGNLLENAMEAVAQLPPEKRWVTCGINEEKTRLSLWVVDNGPGLASFNLDDIFTAGFSTKGSVNRGLGLYLIKNIVESAKGTISIRTVPNSGTFFKIDLPLEEDLDHGEN